MSLRALAWQSRRKPHLPNSQSSRRRISLRWIPTVTSFPRNDKWNIPIYLYSGVGSAHPYRHCEEQRMLRRGNLAEGAVRYAGFPRSLRSHSDCALIAQACGFHLQLQIQSLQKISSFGNPCEQVSSLDIGGMTDGGTPTPKLHFSICHSEEQHMLRRGNLGDSRIWITPFLLMSLRQ